MTNEFGAKIRSLRAGAGLTQEQLAQKLSVTPQAVSKWESGTSMPDILLLPPLSVALGMDRFTKLKVAGLVLGMAGAVAVVLSGAASAHAHSHLWGNVMIFLCACVTSLYMVWFKRLIAKYRITTVLRWVYCAAAVMALPIGIGPIVHTDFAAIARHALFPALFVLIVPTYLPNLMLNYALKT